MARPNSRFVRSLASTVALGGLMLLLSGCGSAEEGSFEKSTGASPANGAMKTRDADSVAIAPDDDEIDAAEILELHLSPNPPHSRERVRVRVDVAGKGHRAEELRYEWKVAGREVPGRGPTIVLAKLPKGAEVSVKVTYTNRSGLSDEREILGRVANQPPRMRDLRLSQSTDPNLAHMWIAEASGDDPDGDDLEYRYTWILNGKVSAFKGKNLSTRELKRGDTVRLRVVAFDGDDESAAAESGTVRVANASPEILSTPPRLGADGRFDYSITAEDPDGDRPMRYELVRGPPGMEIDGRTGRLLWSPEMDQAGNHRIEIAVDDLHGGRATQEFALPIIVETGARSTPAAVR